VSGDIADESIPIKQQRSSTQHSEHVSGSSHQTGGKADNPFIREEKNIEEEEMPKPIIKEVQIKRPSDSVSGDSSDKSSYPNNIMTEPNDYTS